ncbi:MAG: cbb3-type cytochrome c oxidase N-terminal domain-containing protein [Verrucomicrobiales bacterium]
MSDEPTTPNAEAPEKPGAHPSDGPVLRDHVYDGIQEYDQKLPNWWLFTLYITIVWFVIHWFIYYQANGMQSDEERIGAELAALQGARDAELKASVGEITNDRLWEMSRDPAFVDKGKATFNTFCVACHGPDLSGTLAGTKLPGEPLNDSTWKYGGNPLDVLNIVTNGSPDVTKGMVAWGPTLGDKKVAEVVSYVLSHHEPPAGGAAPAPAPTPDDGSTPAPETQEAPAPTPDAGADQPS